VAVCTCRRPGHKLTRSRRSCSVPGPRSVRGRLTDC
jgi:hypothetical protein